MHTVVFDLETVPDMECWYDADKPKRGRGRPKKEETEEGETIRPTPTGFAPIWAHRVICAGVVVFDGNTPTHVDAMGAPNSADEVPLLQGFGDWVESLQANIVTWNGRGFDLPVLELRSFRHGIPQAWYRSGNRYGEDRHVDLCDTLSSYGVRGVTGYNLDTFARLMGLPGKNGSDGSQVAALHEAGEHDKIRQYCKRDTVQTAFVWLRYRLLRGLITAADYRESCTKLWTMCSSDAAFADFPIDVKRVWNG